MFLKSKPKEKIVSFRRHPRRRRASRGAALLLLIGLAGLFGLVLLLQFVFADPPPPPPEVPEIYIAELNREVPWAGQYNSYYDAQTRCRFYLKAEHENGSGYWLYRFDQIAADYGDYGWMRWDYNENRWYIQTDADTFEPLPEKYSDVPLWHIR